MGKLIQGLKDGYARCCTSNTRQCVAWVLVAVAMSLSQTFWGQGTAKMSSQTIKSRQAERFQRVLPAPNLIWQSRQGATETLKAAGLNQGRVIDDGQETSVVIEQSVAPGTQVAAGSMVGYTVRRPTFVLKPSEFRPEVGKAVHFDAELVPQLASPERILRTYIFTFSQKPGPNQTSQSQRESKPSTDYKFEQSGSYFVVVSASLNGINVASEPVEIQVQNPVSAGTPTPTPTPRKHVTTPTPTKVHTPETTTPSSGSADSLINWPAVFKAVLLLAIIFGTLAVARWYYKRKNSGAPAAKAKISTGNRQIKARIMEPQSLKSRCLTRVRWVRGPLFSTMSPQEKIVEKKGAAHV